MRRRKPIRRSRARITARTDASEEMTQVQFRMPKSLLESLDNYTAHLNKQQSWVQLTRSDVVRGVLEWAARKRPEWRESKRGGDDA